MHGRTADGHVTCQASGSLHDCLAICQASTVDFIIRRCQGSRNIYHGFLWKSGVAASLPAGMEFVPEFHIHCYSCVPTYHGWCARLCSRLYRPADDRASVFYFVTALSPPPPANPPRLALTLALAFAQVAAGWREAHPECVQQILNCVRTSLNSVLYAKYATQAHSRAKSTGTS